MNLTISAGSMLIFLLSAEVAIRGYRTWSHGEPFFRLTAQTPGPIEPDSYLGWKPTANYRPPPFDWKDPDGTLRRVSFSQGVDGFRAYGELDSSRPRIFVVGDSYTQARSVSDDETYYAVAGGLLDAEVFAYGALGYGTLQEYLVLDRYIDRIRPALILWQFCTNDFLNNSRSLDAASFEDDLFSVKPYWEGGKIVWAFPGKHAFGNSVRSWIRQSRLADILFSRLRQLRVRFTRGPIYYTIRAGHDERSFGEASRITDELTGMMRQRAGTIPMVAFDCVCDEPYHGAFKSMASRHGIEVIEEVNTAVLEAERNGARLRADEAGHWNPIGHRIVGEAVAISLTQRSLLGRFAEKQP